uniref:SH3 domain-containing protein n=1 Tax=Otus sunia TaxID=257818 RepID=A0A8C8B498_9STRI
YSIWKSLGIAWNKTRAEYPNGELVPGYIPVFSDGWLPPPVEQGQPGGAQDLPPPASVSPTRSQHSPFPLLPTHGGQDLSPALYEFQGRNPQELSIRMGDTLQVLDQRKKWWLVQDNQGEKGYVPSNILEPLGQGHGGGHSASQVGVPSPAPSPEGPTGQGCPQPPPTRLCTAGGSQGTKPPPAPPNFISAASLAGRNELMRSRGGSRAPFPGEWGGGG